MLTLIEISTTEDVIAQMLGIQTSNHKNIEATIENKEKIEQFSSDIGRQGLLAARDTANRLVSRITEELLLQG